LLGTLIYRILDNEQKNLGTRVYVLPRMAAAGEPELQLAMDSLDSASNTLPVTGATPTAVIEMEFTDARSNRKRSNMQTYGFFLGKD
jgi:hypothetical protein